jgi:peptidyl-prolyl cis-trans isomerase B (cyclophilin B)
MCQLQANNYARFAKNVKVATILSMLKLKLTLLTFFLFIFGFIFWLTQKDSLSKITTNPFPTISLPPEEIKPFTTNSPVNSSAGMAEQQVTTTEVQGPVKEDTRATFSAQIRTSKGNITIMLYNADAKQAVKNFVQKAKDGFYKNLTFHRVEDWVIQGGDPKGDGTGGGSFQSELNNKPFVAGSLGFAASSSMQIGQGMRISNDAQFFIVKQDASWLDPNYTNFGIVTEGMDVVNKIQKGDKILDIVIE